MSGRSDAIRFSRETVAYTMACDPNRFPGHEGLPDDEQMTLDRAFAELRTELDAIAAVSPTDVDALVECCRAADEALAHHGRGDSDAGVLRTQEVDHALRALGKL